jgi:hypothetical protein
MNRLAPSILFLLLGIAAPCRGQSAADLSAKYPVVAAYEVRPGIMMTPSYASDGQVCEMMLERHTAVTKTKTTMNFGLPLSKELVNEIVDELVPPSERGKELTDFKNWLGTTIEGGFITTDHAYENVVVRVYGITRPEPGGDIVVTITWRKRTCSGAQQPAARLQKPTADAQTVSQKDGRHLQIPFVASSKPK